MEKEIDLVLLNDKFKNLSAQEIIVKSLNLTKGTTIVSTNFSPYEAVIIHLCVRACSSVKVVWVDSGYMLPETYQFADKLIKKLDLQDNLLVYTPVVTKARREAILGDTLPNFNDEQSLKDFADEVKLEPFKRALTELNPSLWFTALRKEQNQFRQSLDYISLQGTILKVNPILDWKEEDLKQYLEKFDLPNETIYFDPSKASQSRECGLHNRL